MSIGAFLGFRSAFIPGAPNAARELQAVDRALRAAGLRPYREDTDPVRVRQRYETLHKHSRSALDHTGSRSLRSFGSLGEQVLGAKAGPLADLAQCAELRLVPGTFPNGLVAPELPSGHLWSTGALLEALVALAPTLSIPLPDGALGDETIHAINQIAPFPGDPPGAWDLFEDHRPNWLLLFEFGRIAHDYQTALVLGG